MAAPVRTPHPKYRGIAVRVLSDGRTKRYDVAYTTADGKRSMRSFPNLGDARAFLAERVRLRVVERTGIDTRRGTETFNAHVNWWWENYAKVRLEPETRKVHAASIKTHLSPRIGHLQLRQITPEVVFDLLSDMQRKGVGGAQITRTMSVLSGILKRAVERGRIDSNPVRDIEIPRAVRQGIIRPWSVDQVERIRAILDRSDDRLYVSLQAYAGVRPAEARALTVASIRWAEGSIDIDGRGTGREHRRGNKADGGRTMELLDALRADLMEAGIDKVDDPTRHVLVTPSGRPWSREDHRRFRARWRSALEALKLPPQRSYILRHTHASLRIYEQRWTDADIARMLGHDVKTLHEHYSHLMREAAGRGPLDLAHAIRVARDRHGTHPVGVVLPKPDPVKLTITGTDRYGADDAAIARYQRVLAEAGLTDIKIERADQ